jgi:hypothetical protein
MFYFDSSYYLLIAYSASLITDFIYLTEILPMK